ncbi:MAG: formamidopyrimidine-DNA glycosylase [Planctomycetes bacterium]|nr:formamidopyrimidine-DNA glycosylase [Planctomycetota bacterium]
MPELPDITVYAEALQARIGGAALERVDLNNAFLLRTVEPPVARALGRRVARVGRLGKRIVIDFDNGVSLLLHLMIAGRLHWRPENNKNFGRGRIAEFVFSTGALVWTEAGTKRRASLHLVEGDAAFAALRRDGPEPLECTFVDFRASLVKENHTLKRALTDPDLVSGIGNAYSDEILHHARLSPVALTSRLADAEWRRLYDSTRNVLMIWIARLRAEADGKFPEDVTAFRPEMAVHGRYRKPCPDCDTEIQRIRHADNEINYCPRCQTGGKLLADRSLSQLLKSDWPKTIDELETRRGRLP